MLGMPLANDQFVSANKSQHQVHKVTELTVSEIREKLCLSLAGLKSHMCIYVRIMTLK